MPVLTRIRTYPVKSLDGVDHEAVAVVENGGLAADREFAVVDGQGNYVNGKRTRRVHPIRSAFDPASRTLELTTPGREPRGFDVDDERDAVAAWLADWFDEPVELVQDRAGGMPDDTDASGPTVLSTATLEEVASWFDGIDVAGMRRRLRPNLEVAAGPDEAPLPAFWEDRLFGDRDEVVEFAVGDVSLVGVNPCQRCVVPSRDPDTGEEHDGFRETFVERRRGTMPPWSGGDWFDHHFRLMVNTRVDRASWGAELRVGDRVRVGATVPADD